jgi:hypothetical protein
MKLIVKIIMFIILGAFFLFSLPCFLLIATGSTLVKYGKGDDPFMEIAKEEFSDVFECFNPIRIVFKKD